VQIISGNYIHQHNDGDGDKACGDGVGMLLHPHVILHFVPQLK